MNNKWDRSTMRITSARFVRSCAMLDVVFQNGDRFLVAVESLLSHAHDCLTQNRSSNGARRAEQEFLWTKMRVGETGDVLEVPSRDGLTEIPWDRIRSVMDPEFRAHLARMATRRDRLLGKRIRSIRLKQHLSCTSVAEKLGISRQELADLEAGKTELGAKLIEEIAAALGVQLQDFAEA